MSVLRVKAAQAIADVIARVLPSLAQPPVVIAAPTSLPTAYPAMAVTLDRFTMAVHGDDPYQVDGATVEISPGKVLVKVADIGAEGRIWIGARTPPQREALEDAALLAWFSDDGAPGRILLELPGVTIGGLTLEFPVIVAATLRSESWASEFAYGERHWAWLDFDMDIPLLTTRGPIVRELRLALTDESSTEAMAIDADANITAI